MVPFLFWKNLPCRRKVLLHFELFNDQEINISQPYILSLLIVFAWFIILHRRMKHVGEKRSIDAVIRTATPYVLTFYREIEGVTDISIKPLSTLLYLTAAANF